MVVTKFGATPTAQLNTETDIVIEYVVPIRTIVPNASVVLECPKTVGQKEAQCVFSNVRATVGVNLGISQSSFLDFKLVGDSETGQENGVFVRLGDLANLGKS